MAMLNNLGYKGFSMAIYEGFSMIIPYIMENKIHVWNHQAVYIYI